MLDGVMEWHNTHEAGTGSNEFTLIYDPQQPVPANRLSSGSGLQWIPVPKSMQVKTYLRRSTTQINGDLNALIADLRLDLLHLFGVLDFAVSLPAHIVACPYVATVERLAPCMRDATGLEWYIERLGLLMRAQHIFAIDEHVGHDIGAVLGLSDQQISSNSPHNAERFIQEYQTWAGSTERNEFRIAMWTPLRPTRSGIADYVEELLPFLSEEEPLNLGVAPVKPVKLDIYTLDEPENDEVRDRCAVLSPTAFEAIHRRRPYDALIYQIGATPEHHNYICEQSLKHPGLLVMHDPNIHSYALARLQGGKGLPAYLKLVQEELGAAEARSIKQAWIDGTFADAIAYKYPLDRWLLKNSRGVIYHSYSAVLDEQKRLPSVPAFYVPLYAPTPARSNESQRQHIFQRNGWPSDTIVIGAYGIVAPSKRVNVLLQAFERLAVLYPQVILAIVGNASHYDIAGEIKHLGLDPGHICVTGEVSSQDLLAYMQAADIGVNLRYPSLGESSAIISRLIGMGKPVITSDIPQFSELPDEFCWKVPVGDHEVEVLVIYLSEMIRDQNLRQQMGQAALNYARESMSPQLAAHAYRQIAEHIFCGGVEPHLENMIPAQYRQRAVTTVDRRQLPYHTQIH
jgi:glycosyltransferase involved in cell wall biosynthesis